MPQQTITLAPGESQVVSFETVPTQARTYRVTVDGLTGTFTAVEAPGIATLLGFVTDIDTGQPIFGVLVIIQEHALSGPPPGERRIWKVMTNYDGSYLIANLPTGEYTVAFRMYGFYKEVKFLTMPIVAGENRLDIQMLLIAPSPPPLEVTARGTVYGWVWVWNPDGVTGHWEKRLWPNTLVSYQGHRTRGIWETFTNAIGVYQFTFPLDLYDISISATGFLEKTWEAVPIIPGINDNLKLEFDYPLREA